MNVQTRLLALRKTIRRRLVAYGACSVAAGAVATFLGVVALDWAFELPAMLRALGGGLLAVGFAAAAGRWIVGPMRARLSIEEIAGRLERHFPDLHDRLLAAVNFLKRAAGGVKSQDSAALTRQVLVDTNRIVSGLSLESALTLRPLAVRFASCMLAAAALAVVLLAAPGWARTGFYRYVHPFGGIEWPREYTIVPLTGEMTVAVGESVTVRMAVHRGRQRGSLPYRVGADRDATVRERAVSRADSSDIAVGPAGPASSRSSMRALVHLRETDGTTSTLAMRRDQGGTFAATIDVVTKALEYWFEAGDASTAQSPFLIRVVRRPEVVEATAAVEPPPYAAGRSIRAFDLAAGPIHAPIGGYVTVTIKSSKPALTDDHLGVERANAETQKPRNPETSKRRNVETSKRQNVETSKRRNPDATVRERANRDTTVGAREDSRTSSLPDATVRERVDETILVSSLYFESGERIPLRGDSVDPLTLSARFAIDRDVVFRASLRDAEGFESRGANRYSIIATPDRPPTLTVLAPRAVTDLTPSGSVGLLVRLEDDFGIARLDLRAEPHNRRVGRAPPDSGDSAVSSPVGRSPTYELKDGSRSTAERFHRLETGATSLTDRLFATRVEDGVEAVVDYLWSVQSMSLLPGDVLVYRFEATDNHAGGDGGQVTRSAPMRINIISDVELDTRLRADLTMLETRVRQAALDQAQLLDQTVPLIRRPGGQGVVQSSSLPSDFLPNQALSEMERESVARLEGRQDRLVRRLRNLGGRFAALERRMELNHAGDEESRDEVGSLGDALVDAATGPMASASRALERTREQVDADTEQSALQEAAREEGRALDHLQGVLRTMSQWGHFQGMLTKTRDLVDRQEAVREDTTALGHRTLGKPLESLTAVESAALKRIKRRQEQLAVDLEQLLERMTQHAETSKRQNVEKSKRKNPDATHPRPERSEGQGTTPPRANRTATVRERVNRTATEGAREDSSTSEGVNKRANRDAIDSALRLARGHDLEKHLRAAVKALEANRTSAATIDQKVAAEALRRMVAALEERDSRKLEQLRKHLARAEQQVAELIEQQQTLLAATQEAVSLGADEETFTGFALKQRGLKRNTKALSEELARLERTAPAASRLAEAVSPMGNAETQLDAGPANDVAPNDVAPVSNRWNRLAVGAQTEALALLQEALAILEELARHAADEMLRRSLDQIREDLEAMLAGQLEVNAGIGRLKAAIEERNPECKDSPCLLRRSEARAASKLARRQADVRQIVDAVLPDLQKVAVFKWALERVAVWMETSRRSLSSRRIDAELGRVARRIAGELEKLIGAIVETESLPLSTDFVESSGSGGGGQGRVVQYKPVPTVAELLVLKAMQVDINQRTRALETSVRVEEADEAELRELTILGEDQVEVRRLTDMVTKRVFER